MTYRIFVFFLVILSHGVAILAPYQFDDLHQIENNPAFLSPSFIPEYFTNPWIGSTLGHVIFYRPLLFLTFLFDGMVGGGSPIPYRITSILLFGLYALVAAKFTTEFLKKISFEKSVGGHGDVSKSDAPPSKFYFFSFLRPIKGTKVEASVGQIVGIIVAVHPLLSENILLASSRSSSLMAIFALSALTALVQIGEKGGQLWKIILFCFFAFLCKETAVVLAPLAVLVVFFSSREKVLWKRLLSAWPIILPVTVYFIFYKTIFPWMAANAIHTPFPSSLAPSVPRDLYPAKGGFAFLGLLKLLFVPWGLSPAHHLAMPKGWTIGFGYGVWIVFPVIAAALFRAGRTPKVIAFAVLWYYLALFPSLVLVPLNTPMAEHRAILAVIAPFIAIAWVLHHLRENYKKVFPVLIVVLTGLSIQEGLYWRTPLILWEHQATLYPESARVWSFVAANHFEDENLDLSKKAILKALAIEPQNPKYIATLAAIAMEKGANHQADLFIEEGLRIEKNLPRLHLLKAQSLAMKNRLELALVHIKKAIELSPRNTAAWNGMGNILWMKGELNKALDAYESAILFDPENEESIQNIMSLQKDLNL